MNWKILEGEFPEKEYKRLEFERKTESDDFIMSSNDKKKSSRQITDDDKVKNADNASIMYNIENMMKFQHIIDEDSKISYMMPMVMWTIVGFIILIIVLMLWMYKEKIWYSYLKPLLEFLWKNLKWLLMAIWRVLFVILFPVMRFLPFRL